MSRIKMSLSQRAKQFLPFAALAGYEDALRLKEQENEYTDRPEFMEEAAEEINTELINLDPGDLCIIRYYNSGMVRMAQGSVKKVDTVFRRIYIDDICVKMDDVMDVQRM